MIIDLTDHEADCLRKWLKDEEDDCSAGVVGGILAKLAQEEADDPNQLKLQIVGNRLVFPDGRDQDA